MGQAAQPRRMGPVGSATWHLMLDGAQAILRDEGNAALTSRRVAEMIGVKQRLVYYYFRTMDDLIVALFKRLAESELARLTEITTSKTPLHDLWDVSVHSADARLVSEFTALANRIDGLGREVIAFIERTRTLQVELLTAAMRRSGGESGLSAAALAFLATSAALALARENELGVDMGHGDVRQAIEAFLDIIEPAPLSR